VILALLEGASHRMTDVIYDICVPRGTLKLHEPWGTLTGSFRPKKNLNPLIGKLTFPSVRFRWWRSPPHKTKGVIRSNYLILWPRSHYLLKSIDPRPDFAPVPSKTRKSSDNTADNLNFSKAVTVASDNSNSQQQTDKQFA
jgi:hypothetical protein